MWRIEYTKHFLKELAELPDELQKRVEKIVFEELMDANPFELRYIEKLTGYKAKYKVRIGDYRIGLTIDKVEKIITCCRIAHRKDIYKIFP